MENSIKKVFGRKIDDELHGEFIKFSRGVFANRYLIDAKLNAGKYSIKTGPEFANFFVRSCLKMLQGDVDITGAIVSTFNIKEKMGGTVFNPDEEVKQFMGIKQLKVNGKISPQKVLDLMDKFPRAFFALTFSGNDFDLKIKPKAPKSAKPSTKGEDEIKADFCSLKTVNKELANDLFFDVPEFKEIHINHTIKIENIILPKDEKDPVKLRENAIRKGKMIRKITADGKISEKETDFEI
jgi:hypothetical protein